MMMDIFLLGGWVARQIAFYFVAFLCSPCLILSYLAVRGRLACSLFTLLYLVALVRAVTLSIFAHCPCSCA